MSGDIKIQIWEKQQLWSKTATDLKNKLGLWRNVILFLGVSGAFLETLSTQLNNEVSQNIIAWIGAGCLTAIPALLHRKVNSRNTINWIRARSASESLKSEAYMFYAKSCPYDDENAIQTLREKKNKILDSVKDIVNCTVLIDQDEPIPEEKLSYLTPNDYINKRLLQQISWYRKEAKKYANLSIVFRKIEFILFISAAVIASANGIWGDVLYFRFVSINIGAWVAVMTTIGGAITSHVGSNRYDYLVNGYSTTADHIEDIASQWPPKAPAPSEQWSDFVNQCESAISIENKSWMAKWSKTAREENSIS